MQTDRAFVRNTLIMVVGAAVLLVGLAWFASDWARSGPTAATAPAPRAAPASDTTITSGEQRAREAPPTTPTKATAAAPASTPSNVPAPRATESRPAPGAFTPAPYMPPPPDWQPPPGWSYTPPLVLTADGGIAPQDAPVYIPNQAAPAPSTP